MAPHAPSDDWSPLDPTQRHAQVLGLRPWIARRLQSSREDVRVLDLGCGDGSVIAALLDTGASFVGLDRDTRARQAARRRLRGRRNAAIIDADFTDPRHHARWRGPFDLVLCLGHTWMLVLDDEAARDVFTWVAQRLRPGGNLVLDNFPDELWRLIESGQWRTGLSEDGSCQMILDERRGLVALRCGDEIDASCEIFSAGDRLCRLWTTQELRALARSSGLRAPRADAAHHLLWFARQR